MNTRESEFCSSKIVPRICAEHFNEILTTSADIALFVDSKGFVHSAASPSADSEIGDIARWEGRN